MSLDQAKTMRLSFYHLVANFNKFKNGLYPKYYEEETKLLDRWHCNDDIENIEKYINLNSDLKEKYHKDFIEILNEKQNKALTFIAILQVLSIYGAFSDASSLYESYNFILSFSTFVVIIVFALSFKIMGLKKSFFLLLFVASLFSFIAIYHYFDAIIRFIKIWPLVFISFRQ